MRPIEQIIIHCSYTEPDADIGAREIERWHTDPPPKGRGWKAIGYHDVIRRDGTRELGRPTGLAGAHTAGQNWNSIGICLVGGKAEGRADDDCNFTAAQWATLERVVREYAEKYPGIRVTGHRDYSSKSCPTFDASAWWSSIAAR